MKVMGGLACEPAVTRNRIARDRVPGEWLLSGAKVESSQSCISLEPEHFPHPGRLVQVAPFTQVPYGCHDRHQGVNHLRVVHYGSLAVHAVFIATV